MHNPRALLQRLRNWRSQKADLEQVAQAPVSDVQSWPTTPVPLPPFPTTPIPELPEDFFGETLHLSTEGLQEIPWDRGFRMGRKAYPPEQRSMSQQFLRPDRITVQWEIRPMTSEEQAQ